MLLQKKQKEERKARKAAAAAQAPAPATEGHPWRPFNRETDLGQRPKASAADVFKRAGDLGSRFG